MQTEKLYIKHKITKDTAS